MSKAKKQAEKKAKAAVKTTYSVQVMIVENERDGDGNFLDESMVSYPTEVVAFEDRLDATLFYNALNQGYALLGRGQRFTSDVSS